MRQARGCVALYTVRCTNVVMIQAVCIKKSGGVDGLELASVERPSIKPHEARIAVCAAGLNRADILQRKGLYPAPADAPADIPGLEFAGTVLELGSEVQAWSIGDRVMGIVGGGAMARELTTDADQLLPVPQSLSLEEAAAIPEAFVTAFDAMMQANAKTGETLLVHAAASGVGTAVLQLAHLWGITTIGSSRSADKLERAKTYGLDHPIFVRDGSFLETFDDHDLPHPDSIVDLVGGRYLAQNLEVVAERGRIVVVGLVGGRSAELDLGKLLRKRATIIGTVLRTRSQNEKRLLTKSFRQQVMPAFEQDKLRPVVDAILPFESIRDAHTQMEKNATFGKVVLRWETTK